MTNQVVYEDWGLKTLEPDTRKLLEHVMDGMAELVAQRVRAGFAARGSRYGSGKAAGTVVTGKVRGGGAKQLGREVGVKAFYAWWLEFGWVQVVAWGRELKEAIHHPGSHVVRDALESVSREFEERVAGAMRKIGR